MDIKDFQEKIDGAIQEILKLIEKKIKDTTPVSNEIILCNINHQIKYWELYVNKYISNHTFKVINKYDIDVINIILYILKLYGK